MNSCLGVDIEPAKEFEILKILRDIFKYDSQFNSACKEFHLFVARFPKDQQGDLFAILKVLNSFKGMTLQSIQDIKKKNIQTILNNIEEEKVSVADLNSIEFKLARIVYRSMNALALNEAVRYGIRKKDLILFLKDFISEGDKYNIDNVILALGKMPRKVRIVN